MRALEKKGDPAQGETSLHNCAQWQRLLSVYLGRSLLSGSLVLGRCLLSLGGLGLVGLDRLDLLHLGGLP